VTQPTTVPEIHYRIGSAALGHFPGRHDGADASDDSTPATTDAPATSEAPATTAD
jgi:hypothetical protein